MPNTLRRKMFKLGGVANTHGVGITSGLKFKKVGTDSNGYPINEHVDGEPVIEDIKMYNLPYLKDEVIQLIKWLKQNK